MFTVVACGMRLSKPRANMVSSPCSQRWIVFGALVLIAFAVASESKPGSNHDNLSTHFRAISEELDRQFQIMASQMINFTTVNTTGLPYNATTKFNPKGMGQLYNVTNLFIDLIQSKQAFLKGFIKNDEEHPKQLRFADPRAEWKSIVSHYGGLAGLTVAGLILAAILPCVGLFFCCCRCAGHCGARSQPFDKKHDHCRKVLLSIFLIGVATIILFGVVCAFVTNEYMQEGTESLPSNVKVSLKDAELFFTTTKKQINTALTTNYNELEETFSRLLQAVGDSFSKELAAISHAVSLTNLNNIVTGLDAIKKDLHMIDKITNDLRTNASRLNDGVRGVKRDLLTTLVDCKLSQCEQLRNEVNGMAVQIDFNKLPNISLALRNITWLMEGNIVSEVTQGTESFAKIQRDIQSAVNQTIPVVSESVRNAGQSLTDVSNNLTSFIDRINSDINRVYIPNLKYVQDAIDQYSMYRYYLGLSVSGVLLTVLICLTSGLFCGICGKRPDGYGDDCCNKGSGARFLMLAVWVIFLLMSVLMVITSAHMIIGVVAQRGVCEPLKNPEGNNMFEVVNNMVEVNRLLYAKKPDADINLTWILTQCHANETLYKVLKLEHIMDVESLRGYIDRYSIRTTVDQLCKKISLSPGIVILSESASSKLNDLAHSGLSDVEFYQYAESLKDNIMNIDLEHFGMELRNVAEAFARDSDIYINLTRNAEKLEKYHRDTIIPMVSLSEQLNMSAHKLEEHIKFNHSSMSEAIHELVQEVMKAQQFLNEEGPKYVRELATKFGEAFIHQISEFLEHLIVSAQKKIGKCGPLSNAYNATIVAGCNRILDPFNGFWTSVGWCLIMFIPTIILCVKLSALYQKSDPYPGPLVESVHDKKYSGHSRHHHPNAYVESYDDHAGTAAAYSARERIPDAHQGSSHHDSRYSDHAPKNWDFPNGGPPRYQPPPGAPPLSTEYERPPPYYYPGPGDRN